MRRLLLLVLLVAGSASAQPAAEPVDTAAVSFLRAEAIDRGQVMDHATWMTDVNGPRLTASRQLDDAQRWARDRFRAWGLTADLEPWGTFGRGWSIDRFGMTAHVDGRGIASQAFPVYAAPKAWSPSLGQVRAQVVAIDPNSDEDLARWAGRLSDKIVLLGDMSQVDIGLDPIAQRRDDAALLRMANAGPSGGGGGRTYSPEVIARYRAAAERRNRLFAEHPVAILEPSGTGGHGAIRTMAAAIPQPPDASPMTRPQPWAAGVTTTPQFVLLDEHANRIRRLLDAGETVEVDLTFDATFTEPQVEENVIAEIPGTDLADEIVMIGAHQDSWHSGTGATDNAAGSAVVMEAARVLAAYYAERGTGPRRTLRFALWSGEEQGLFGSLGYVNQHFATIPGYGQPATAVKPDQAKVSGYFNLDNGSGRIRGVYLQQNAAVGPIFRAWLDAAADPTAQTLTIQNTGGTDHLSFDTAGIPGFQFIQDPLAYGAQTWHTSMDTYDHLSEDDLKQASMMMALFAHLTAERDAMLPRKPFQVSSGTH